MLTTASCCNEALKLATSCAPYLNNYMMVSRWFNYSADISMSATTRSTPSRSSTRSAPTALCAAESPSRLRSDATGSWKSSWSGSSCVTSCKTIAFAPHLTPSLIKRPSLAYASGKPLYFQAPPQLHAATKDNLDKLVVELVPDGGEIVVTDPALPFSLTVNLSFA